MHMVWHDHKFIQIGVWIMCWKIVPCTGNEFALTGKMDNAVNNITQRPFLVFHANSDEIPSGLRIIAAFQPGMLAVLFDHRFHYSIMTIQEGEGLLTQKLKRTLMHDLLDIGKKTM